MVNEESYEIVEEVVENVNDVDIYNQLLSINKLLSVEIVIVTVLFLYIFVNSILRVRK